LLAAAAIAHINVVFANPTTRTAPLDAIRWPSKFLRFPMARSTEERRAYDLCQAAELYWCFWAVFARMSGEHRGLGQREARW